MDCDKKIRNKSKSRCNGCEFKKRQEESTEFTEEFTKKCIDCNSSISKKATRCPSCASIKFNPRKVENRPSLEQLENDLKEMSMVAVGKKYKVSDNCIRKWIKMYKRNHND